MNAEDYGQHASGYRRPEPDELSRGFTVRLILWSVVFAFGNGITSLMGFGFVPLRLLCLVLSEAGVE